MCSLRVPFFVYYSCFRLFVPLSSAEKTSQNAVDVATCRSADENIQTLQNLTKEELNLYATAQWNYHTNKTDETTEEALKSTVRLFLYQKLLVTFARNMSLALGVNYNDLLPSVYFMHDHGISQLEPSDFNAAIMFKSKLKTMIDGLTVCEYGKTGQPCNVTADEIKFIMANSSDTAELKYYWKAWHNRTSFELKNVYMKYIGLLNHMARLNNFSNEVEYYAKPYLAESCHLNVDRMYEDVKPLYAQLHTRVRKLLRDKYGTAVVSSDGPIPVHLLGSVLGQPWTNLIPNVGDEPVVHSNRKTVAKVETKTVKQLFDQANKFFISIGMEHVPKCVWKKSVFEENDNLVDCTPSSWDMYKNKDFRIKMCYQNTVEDVYTMHKQLGLVHYFSAYKEQPIVFQQTPDAVFVEAVTNALTLSVQYRDFIDRFGDSERSRNAYLWRAATKKVAVLPFAYAADVWHSDAVRGSFAPKRMNDFWWSKRLKYEGVVSPISKNTDKCANPDYKPFDPSASYNMLTELPHIKYFLAPIVEFQLFKALCKLCGEYQTKATNTKKTNLYECNLRGYKKIGKIIKSVMSKGSSMKWQGLFEMIVGHQQIEIEPFLEYFQPLYDHLSAVNNATDEHIGWKLRQNV